MPEQRLPKSVTVPDNLAEQFIKAEESVAKYFKTDPRILAEGKYLVGNQRNIVLQAEFIVALRERVALSMKGELADLITYEVARAFGRKDANDYKEKMQVKDPIGLLFAGPVQLSFRGFAHILILPGSNLVASEEYFLVYDQLDSFEAEVVISSHKPSLRPYCSFSAGYFGGWCEESLGVPLLAREIMCRAKGDTACRFVMAHKNRILEHVTPEAVEKYKELK